MLPAGVRCGHVYCEGRMVRRRSDLARGSHHWILDKCHLGSGPALWCGAGDRSTRPPTSNLHSGQILHRTCSSYSLVSVLKLGFSTHTLLIAYLSWKSDLQKKVFHREINNPKCAPDMLYYRAGISNLYQVTSVCSPR